MAARGAGRTAGNELPRNGIELLSVLLVGREPVLGSWRKVWQLVCLFSVPPLLLILAVGIAWRVVGEGPATVGTAAGAGGGLVLSAAGQAMRKRLWMRASGGGEVPGGPPVGP